MAPNKKAPDIALKALVFADACGAPASRFHATEKLCNAPILSWQLAALARYGVKEVVVLSAAEVEIEYEDPLARMKIQQLCQPSWQCEGDALREVETRADLRPSDDFILVRAGAVFNVSATRLLEEHKKRRAKDRNWLTTTLLHVDDARDGDVAVVVGEDGALRKFSKLATQIELPMDGNLDVYSNVIDCGVDVCAPEFLLEFKENFDFNTVRALTVEKLESGDAETMGNLMYARFVDSHAGEYAARIQNLEQLANITRDVLFGWLAPLSIANVLPQYQEITGNVFVPRDAKPGKQLVGCRNSVCASVSPKAAVINSVLASDVTVTEGARVVDSILMDGTVVQKDAHIVQSIVSRNCVVSKGAKCAPRCVLDDGVTIGENFHLASGTLVTKRSEMEFGPSDPGSDDDDIVAHGMSKIRIGKTDGDGWDEKQVGMNGVGRALSVDVADIDPFLGPKQIDESDDEDEEDDDDGDSVVENGQAEVDRTSEFQQELIELVEKARRKNDTLDNTMLEAHSLRMAYDVTFSHMLAACCIALTRDVVANCASEAAVFQQLQNTFKSYNPLIMKFHQEDALDVVYRLVAEFMTEGKILSQLLYVLYDQDVLEEETILKWAQQEDASNRNEQPYAELKQLIEFLESDDDDDEED